MKQSEKLALLAVTAMLVHLAVIKLEKQMQAAGVYTNSFDAIKTNLAANVEVLEQLASAEKSSEDAALTGLTGATNQEQSQEPAPTVN